ncbi:beta-1,3-glucanase family protein [Actinomadura sp. B10D3]|uniref:beta-1,3-glucanase family protein n=1 Tax=Actinomadura sp. B10D3 TaxID=3153557 RepID=UPI00325D4E30
MHPVPPPAPPYLDMPVNSAGRMYFYLGSPTSRYQDFIEFTVGADVFNGNTTRVDGFGLKLAMRLHAHDGYDVSVGEDQATFAEDRAATFRRFADEVPPEFDSLATVEAPYRMRRATRPSSSRAARRRATSRPTPRPQASRSRRSRSPDAPGRSRTTPGPPRADRSRPR